MILSIIIFFLRIGCNITGKEKAPFTGLSEIKRWSCRESNPGPNKFTIRFLHAYLMINCRRYAGPQPTNIMLSCMFLSFAHSLAKQQPVLVLSRRRGVVTDQPARRPEWLLNHWLSGHGILCIAIWVLNIQIKVLIIQRTACLYVQRTMLSKPVSPVCKK